MISKVEFLQQDFQNVRCFPKRNFWNKFSRTYEILEQVFCNKSYETHEMLFSETEFLKQNFQENFLKTMKYFVDEFFETNFLPNTTLYSLSLCVSLSLSLRFVLPFKECAVKNESATKKTRC